MSLANRITRVWYNLQLTLSIGITGRVKVTASNFNVDTTLNFGKSTFYES